jgi:iron complex outermembrane receptor protein
LGGNISIGKNTLDVYLSGTNLLNKTYLDHMSLFRPFGINQMGRNIALNVRIPF